MKYDTYWQKVVADIRELSKQLYGYPWSYEKIGERVNMSRSSVWRLSQPESIKVTIFDNSKAWMANEHHLSEPKFSEGMALSMLCLELLERWQVEKENQNE